MAYLAEMLKINKTLTEIDLTNNQIEIDGAQVTADALQTNTVILIVFYLSILFSSL